MRDATMLRAFARAFTEWDRRYRADPRQFMTDVEHLLGHTPKTYGDGAAAYFTALLDELAKGRPWNQIGARKAR